MIHLVHVLDSLAVGGAETGVVNLINATRRSFEHTVVTMTSLGPLAERLPPEVALRCLHKRPGIDLKAILKLSILLRRLRPAAVHSRNWGALDAVMAARLAGVRVVIHGEHGREASDPHGLDRRRNRIRKALAPLVSRFVTVSSDLGRWLVGTVGIRADKVVTIHNGVDIDRFAAGDRHATRRALGLSDDAVVIGTVGRLDPIKDQAALVAAFAQLDDVRPRPTLVIVGEGPSRRRLEAEIIRLGLGDRVLLAGERRDIPDVLAALDIFTLPSLGEGISNTILEAMAAGLPVVTTDVGGNPELVEHDVTGLLVAPANPTALAAALRVYSTDAGLATLHGKAGRERAARDLSLDHMARAYTGLYASLCAARRVGRGN
jgi:sugar transferase (PEP-CTERM/EpsH1 system associated)